MNRQNLVISFYGLTLRFLRRFGLPIILLLCYLTAIGLRFLGDMNPFNRIDLELAHRAFGLLLCSLLVALMYDRFMVKKRKKVSLSKAKDRLRELSAEGPRVWVTPLFFSFLGLIVLLGLILHFKTRLGVSGGVPLAWVYGLHSTIVWFFLSLILVRYYLTLSGWLASFWAYLKEY